MKYSIPFQCSFSHKVVFAQLISLVLATSIAIAGDQSPDLRFELRANTESVFVYEPVIVRVRLTNIGTKPIVTEGIGRDPDYVCSLQLKRKDGEFRTWSPSRPSFDGLKTRSLPIAPKESLEFAEEISWRMDDPVLDSPGKFEIRARYHGKAGDFEDTCAVSVQEPTGKDLECLKSIREHDLLELITEASSNKYLLRQSSKSRDVIRRNVQADVDAACDIVRTFPDTRYGIRLAENIIRVMRFTGANDFPELQLDRTRTKAFIEWLELYEKSHPNARVLWHLAFYFEDSDPEKAKHLLDQVRNAQPEPWYEARIKSLGKRLKVKTGS